MSASMQSDTANGQNSNSYKGEDPFSGTIHLPISKEKAKPESEQSKSAPKPSVFMPHNRRNLTPLSGVSDAKSKAVHASPVNHLHLTSAQPHFAVQPPARFGTLPSQPLRSQSFQPKGQPRLQPPQPATARSGLRQAQSGRSANLHNVYSDMRISNLNSRLSQPESPIAEQRPPHSEGSNVNPRPPQHDVVDLVTKSPEVRPSRLSRSRKLAQPPTKKLPSHGIPLRSVRPNSISDRPRSSRLLVRTNTHLDHPPRAASHPPLPPTNCSAVPIDVEKFSPSASGSCHPLVEANLPSARPQNLPRHNAIATPNAGKPVIRRPLRSIPVEPLKKKTESQTDLTAKPTSSSSPVRIGSDDEQTTTHPVFTQQVSISSGADKKQRRQSVLLSSVRTSSGPARSSSVIADPLTSVQPNGAMKGVNKRAVAQASTARLPDIAPINLDGPGNPDPTSRNGKWSRLPKTSSRPSLNTDPSRDHGLTEDPGELPRIPRRSASGENVTPPRENIPACTLASPLPLSPVAHGNGSMHRKRPRSVMPVDFENTSKQVRSVEIARVTRASADDPSGQAATLSVGVQRATKVPFLVDGPAGLVEEPTAAPSPAPAPRFARMSQRKNTEKWWESIKPDVGHMKKILQLSLEQHPSLLMFSFFGLHDSDCRNLLEGIPASESFELQIELNNNRVHTLTEYLCQRFAALKVCRLDISNNKVLEIPSSIAACTKIRNLNLSRNRLTNLPESICSLDSLEVLDISYNNITSLPLGMGKLINLEYFCATANGLEELPDDMAQEGSGMLCINLSDNEELQRLPPCVLHWKKLSKIQLEGTRLYTILTGKEQQLDAQSLIALLAGGRKHGQDTTPKRRRLASVDSDDVKEV